MTIRFNAEGPGPVPSHKAVARYGTWPSPLTAPLLAGGSIGFSELSVDGDDVYWLESRPAEQGRRALVRSRPGVAPVDVLPATADAGTRVHEYGGGAYAVRGGCIIYSERDDGSVHLVADGAVRTIAAVPGCRYAAFALDLERERVFAVREDHRGRPPTAPDNALVTLSLAAGLVAEDNAGEIVASGTDFVLAPQLSPDGRRLAWITWNHPAMPFEATRLWLAGIDDAGALYDVRCVAGDAGDESIVDAGWTPGGTLLFNSDRSGWWNVYALRTGGAEALAPVEAEIGEPPWVFGRRAFAAIDEDRVLCAVLRDGHVRAGLIAGGALHDVPYGGVDTTPLPAGAGAVWIARPADGPAAICRAARLGEPVWEVLRAENLHDLVPGDISTAEPHTAPTPDGERTHYLFYPPRNARYDGPHGDRPPLVVMSHGGPTSVHTDGLALAIQWWTTRGFAVAHVNYRGSSGFGRAYRSRLAGQWGVLDVADCVAVAERLVADGRCDPERIAIRGGSASGMTTLLALATSDVFRAGASLYGVMELESLAADTHKFESRYTDGLIGPLPAARNVYRERSPVTHAASIRVPVILFQGLDDHVVPPSQAAAMRDALAARGVPVAYETFAGEGHGFRKAETIVRVLESELAFYRDAFGLTD
jgi:dipeptidyl aminopeptidase/acylaminoacyl peptidase